MKKNAMSAGIWYTVGNILIKGINFLAIPIFSRIMSTDEFGIYNVFISYEAILYIVIGFAVHTSIRSANIKFENQIDKYTSSVSLIYIYMSIDMIILTFIFEKFLVKTLDFSLEVIILLVVYSFGCAILTLYNNRIALEYEYKQYLIISFINSIGNIGISLLLILTLFSKKRELARILGCTATIFAISLYILHEFYKKEKPKYKKEYWGFAIKYSLPIVPHGIAQVLLAQFDRIMIRKIVSNSAAGIYSLAGNIKLILVIITESISTAWSTWFYEKVEENKFEIIQEKSSQLIIVFSILSIGLLTIAPEIIFILGGEAYKKATYVAVPMIIDAFILFIYNIIVTGEYYTGKTKYVMYGTLVAAFIDIISNYIFINMFGYYAAAYTTLFSYVCYVILHIVISKKVLSFYVVPLKIILCYGTLVSAIAILDILFVNKVLVRILIGFASVLVLSIFLLKKVDFNEKIKKYVNNK